MPDITIRYVKKYYKEQNLTKKKCFLFEGFSDKKHINCKSITNYFTSLKNKYNLLNEVTTHTLKHSFANNYNDLIGVKNEQQLYSPSYISKIWHELY